jgi:GntR family transcriptional regulator
MQYQRILEEDDKLPNEMELCKVFDVSRITVRNALMKLQRDGYLSRQRAKGTFVSSRAITFQYVSETMGLGEELVKKNIGIKDKVLRCEIIGANEIIAENLGISTGFEGLSLWRA